MATCETCGGYGSIITCCDDLCVAGHHCIHGDGEDLCPECTGWGDVDDDEYLGDGQAVVYDTPETVDRKMAQVGTIMDLYLKHFGPQAAERE